jgi:hypothetical protein
MQEIRSRSHHVLSLEGIIRDLRHGRPLILSGSIDPGLRKLKKENERLKKIIAEKELEVSLLQDAYKKTRGKRCSLSTDPGG